MLKLCSYARIYLNLIKVIQDFRLQLRLSGGIQTESRKVRRRDQTTNLLSKYTYSKISKSLQEQLTRCLTCLETQEDSKKQSKLLVYYSYSFTVSFSVMNLTNMSFKRFSKNTRRIKNKDSHSSVVLFLSLYRKVFLIFVETKKRREQYKTV